MANAAVLRAAAQLSPLSTSRARRDRLSRLQLVAAAHRTRPPGKPARARADAEGWSARTSSSAVCEPARRVASAALAGLLAWALNAHDACSTDIYGRERFADEQATLKEAWGHVREQFVDWKQLGDDFDWDSILKTSLDRMASAETKEQAYGIIQETLKKLGDRYTRIVPPSHAELFNADTTGQVVHVGIGVARGRGSLTVPTSQVFVASVIEGSAAEMAGVRGGDRILALNGRSPATISDREMAGLLHADVEVVLQRGAQAMTLRVSAQPIEVHPVLVATLLGAGGPTTGYIGIQAFGQNTSRDVEAGLTSVLRAGAANLILDLRGNSGGMVSAGIGVARLFLQPGQLFCYVVNRVGAEEAMPLDDARPRTHAPLAVLVDRATASTSEMLTAALAANERVAVVGEHTFGKGRTQHIIELHDASVLLVSNNLITTPRHARIDKVGLEPDLACPMPRTGGMGAEAAAMGSEAGLAERLGRDPCIALARQHLHTLGPALTATST